MKNIRVQTLGEEITNAILHGIGLGLAIAALVVLVVLASRRGTVWYQAGFAIYGSTLVILYLSSTLYHSFPEGKAKKVFRIFDHSSIYLLIAGTYTPIVLTKLRGPLGWAIFGTIWAMTLVGIVTKAIWINKTNILSTIIYIMMGWLIIIAIKPLLAVLDKISIAFLVLGGLFYTLGTIFYAGKKMKYNHAIWHLFVLAGSICHFFTILFLLPA